MPVLQKQQRVGIDEVVAHSDRPDFVANTDPELRMWDALDAGTHDDTLQNAILDHMQVLWPLSASGPRTDVLCLLIIAHVWACLVFS